MDPARTTPETLIDGPAGWEGRITGGFRLARVSWEVLAGDRRLLVLPLLATLGPVGALRRSVATVGGSFTEGFAGFPAGDLERPRDGRPLHALRRLRRRVAS